MKKPKLFVVRLTRREISHIRQCVNQEACALDRGGMNHEVPELDADILNLYNIDKKLAKAIR